MGSHSEQTLACFSQARTRLEEQEQGYPALKQRSTAAPMMRLARYNRAARPDRVQYDNHVRPRALLLTAIDQMLAMLMQLVASSPHIALLDEGREGSTFYFLQCSAWMSCACCISRALTCILCVNTPNELPHASSRAPLCPWGVVTALRLVVPLRRFPLGES